MLSMNLTPEIRNPKCNFNFFFTPSIINKFLFKFLPAELLKRLDLASLEIVTTCANPSAVSPFPTPFVYKTRLREEPVVLYILLEPLSAFSCALPERLLNTCCSIIDFHMTQTLSPGPHWELPFVHCMVMYTGESFFAMPPPVLNLFADDDALIEGRKHWSYQLVAMPDASFFV